MTKLSAVSSRGSLCRRIQTFTLFKLDRESVGLTVAGLPIRPADGELAHGVTLPGNFLEQPE